MRRSYDVFWKDTVYKPSRQESLIKKAEALGARAYFQEEDDCGKNKHLTEGYNSFDFLQELLLHQQHSFTSLICVEYHQFPGTGKCRDPVLLEYEMGKDW